MPEPLALRSTNAKEFPILLVDVYARRLQLQRAPDRADLQRVMESIKAKGVGVMIEARHLCMMMRGVEKQNSTM